MKSTFAIIDKRSPAAAIDKLAKHVDDVHLFCSNGITYNSISCHPDVFIYQDESKVVVAPNAPSSLTEFMKRYFIDFITGDNPVGQTLESSTLYNCVVSENIFFHKRGFTDPAILNLSPKKKFVNLPQAYTRCSLLHINNNNFITSDKGIEKALLTNGLNCFYFEPSQIRIHDHKHGFFGGASGMFDNTLFTIGNVEKHLDGKKLLQFLDKSEVDLIPLCNDYLYDGGGIFFIESG